MIKHKILKITTFTLLFFLPFILFAQSKNKYEQELRSQIQTTSSDTERAKLYGLLAWELRFSNPTEAITLANHELAIGYSQKNPLILADAYQIKALTLVIEENIIEGLANYDSCLIYARKAKSLYYEASCYNLIAGMYGDHSDYYKAIDLYSKGLSIAEKLGDPKMIASLSNNLAETYQSDKRNTKLTQKHFTYALENSIKIKNWSAAAMNSANLAKEFLNAGELQNVKHELIRSIDLLNKDKKDAYQFATNSHVLASIYSDLNNMADAEKYATISLRIMDSLLRPDNALRPLKELTKVYLATKNISKAESFAKRLLHDATAQNAKLYIKDAYMALSDIAKLKNNFQESLKLYVLYKSWNDSVFEIGRELSISNVETRAQLAQKDIEIKYETEKKIKENDTLKEQNDNLERQKIIALVACCIFILLVVLLYLSNRKKNKINNALEIEKKIVEQQGKEKEMLMHEIHHRVKNNLQVISGLLELQKEELKDEASKAAFDEGQSRINSISLIHQNLYQNENLGAIEFKKFVKDLSQQVKEVFEQFNYKSEVHIIMPDNILDIDTAVPLGLIVNELLTNSYKYATTKNKICLITIELKDKGEGEFILRYSDNGPGIKSNIDFNSAKTMGLRLIKGLSGQLAGKASYSNAHGSEFTIEFKDRDARSRT